MESQKNEKLCPQIQYVYKRDTHRARSCFLSTCPYSLSYEHVDSSEDNIHRAVRNVFLFIGKDSPVLFYLLSFYLALYSYAVHKG